VYRSSFCRSSCSEFRSARRAVRCWTYTPIEDMAKLYEGSLIVLRFLWIVHARCKKRVARIRSIDSLFLRQYRTLPFKSLIWGSDPPATVTTLPPLPSFPPLHLSYAVPSGSSSAACTPNGYSRSYSLQPPSVKLRTFISCGNFLKAIWPKQM